MLSVFTRLAAVHTGAFLVFLNFVQSGMPPAQYPTMQQTTEMRTSVVIPRPDDSSVLSTFDHKMRPLVVRTDLPRPYPTNAWWSSGTLEDWPAPLFPYPFMVNFTKDGTIINAPDRETVPKAVVHAPRDLLTLTSNPLATASRIQSWGDFDVTFQMQSGTKPLADVTLMQGSPFVFFRSKGANFQLKLQPDGKTSSVACPGCQSLLITGPVRRYLLTVSAGGSLTPSTGSVAISAPNAVVFSIAVLANGSDPAAYISHALQPVQGTTVSYRVLPDTVETTFHAPVPTLMGLLPHHSATLQSGVGPSLGTYTTVRGTIDLRPAQSFTTVVVRPPVIPGLPLPGNVTALRSFLAQEVPSSGGTQGDIYAAAKAFTRTAQLADLAQQAGDADLANAGKDALRRMFDDWCGGGDRSIAFDSQLGGIVPLPPAFGSEHFNDHHFHAGYLIHAAAILARLDGSFTSSYGDCIDLIIRDVASANRNDLSFPYLRHFDAYAGHSWANGLTRFGDGQNQESTSEALQAWYGIALWGKVTKNKSLEDLGTWMLSQEALGTRTYWLNATPGHSTFPANFPHPLISILWGGKIDYATFFDANPQAIHGIQFFPATSALLSVLDPTIIARSVAPLTTSTQSIMWKNTLQMAAALDGSPRTISAKEEIDPVYSRSYVAAWLGALSDLGGYDPSYRSSGCNGAVFTKNGKKSAVVYRFDGDAASCTFVNTQGGRSTVSGLVGGWNVKGL